MCCVGGEVICGEVLKSVCTSVMCDECEDVDWDDETDGSE